MKLSKRQLKRIIREVYTRINRQNRLIEGNEDPDDEIIDSFDTETLIITQYTDGFVQIEKRGDPRGIIDFESTELPAVIAALRKMELIK